MLVAGGVPATTPIRFALETRIGQRLDAVEPGAGPEHQRIGACGSRGWCSATSSSPCGNPMMTSQRARFSVLRTKPIDLRKPGVGHDLLPSFAREAARPSLFSNPSSCLVGERQLCGSAQTRKTFGSMSSIDTRDRRVPGGLAPALGATSAGMPTAREMPIGGTPRMRRHRVCSLVDEFGALTSARRDRPLRPCRRLRLRLALCRSPATERVVGPRPQIDVDDRRDNT